jgi:tetratricopeptide (TPR) repeat protein
MEQKFDKAAQHYREAISISPANPQLYANLGDTLIRQNNISEAVQYYQTALSLNPGDAKTKAKLQALGLKP